MPVQEPDPFDAKQVLALIRSDIAAVDSTVTKELDITEIGVPHRDAALVDSWFTQHKLVALSAATVVVLVAAVILYLFRHHA